MFPFILCTALVAIIALLALYIRRNPYDELPAKKGGDDCTDDCTTCFDTCASSRILDAQVAAPKYFNDEELDAFAGTPGGDYDDEQTDVFRSVFETLQPDEVVEWTESLRRRGIEIPNALKDEVMMMLNDR